MNFIRVAGLRAAIYSLLLWLPVGTPQVAARPQPAAVMWQNMPLIALLNGYLAGNVTVGTALSHGDFGLGAYEGLSGEMVALNGKMYAISDDGMPQERPASSRLAYAQMIRFRPTRKIALPAGTTMETIAKIVAAELATGNATYAVRITGSFDALTTRAPHKQPQPYPLFCEAIKNQVTFPLDGREGAMAGFVGPPYISTIDAVGYHLHFLAKDGTAGGHALSFRTQKTTIELQKVDRVIVDTPQDPLFDRVPTATLATCP